MDHPGVGLIGAGALDLHKEDGADVAPSVRTQPLHLRGEIVQPGKRRAHRGVPVCSGHRLKVQVHFDRALPRQLAPRDFHQDVSRRPGKAGREAVAFRSATSTGVALSSGTKQGVKP